MRLHRPIMTQVVTALKQIFGEGYHADKVIERIFKNNRQLGARDRRFVAETTYECVRWWRLLWSTLARDESSLEERDLWLLLGAWLILRNEQLPQWPEFKSLDPELVQRNAQIAQKTATLRESIPDWMHELGVRELKDQWESILTELNRPAPVVLRANRLKTNRIDLSKRLQKDSVETVEAPQTEDGLILKERKNVFSTECFKLGHFEVQDGASQQIAPMVDVEPGHRVIDACAGAGGKTLHLAALMKNKGKLIAMDVHDRKLEELRTRCTRAGVDIVETRLIDSAKTIKRLAKSADRLLLDVPCSGMGVLRRNPDSKWKLTLAEIDRLRALQAQIISDYSQMVKPGGRLVYATCSCLPSENELQVEAFLSSNNGQWRLLDQRSFRPGADGYDGFYAASLERI